MEEGLDSLDLMLLLSLSVRRLVGLENSLGLINPDPLLFLLSILTERSNTSFSLKFVLKTSSFLETDGSVVVRSLNRSSFRVTSFTLLSSPYLQYSSLE